MSPANPLRIPSDPSPHALDAMAKQGIKLEQVEKLELGSPGYALDTAGRVVGLALFGAQVSDLSPLSGLSQLQVLN